jgi:hypothetical protein
VKVPRRSKGAGAGYCSEHYDALLMLGVLLMHQKLRHGFTVMAVTMSLLPLSATPAHAGDSDDIDKAADKNADDTVDHVKDIIDNVLHDVLDSLDRNHDRG